MEIVLGLDIDGVVLNYGPSLMEHGRLLGLRIGCEWHEVDMYDMKKAFPDLSKDEIMALVAEFSVHERFGQIVEMEGVTEALKSLKEEFPGLRLVAITSAGEDERTIALRRQNVEKFGFDEVHVLPLHVSKEDHLAALPKGSLFVDDLKRHVDSATKVGLTGVLVRQPYNSADTHDHVMEGWEHGRELIASLLRANLAELKKAA